MVAQFQRYAEKIDLIPMAGTASIPLKRKIAKRLEYYISTKKEGCIK